jgi:methyl-accepting chemotaxis protein
MANPLNNIRIAIKLPVMVVLMIAGALAIVSYQGISAAKSALETAYSSELKALVSARADELDGYLDSIAEDLTTLQGSEQVIHALQLYTAAWDKLGDKPKDTLQNWYITENPNPTGQKEKLDFAAADSEYNAVHKNYHPWFRNFLQKRGYYDIFLFDMHGNVVYTVFKELDFASNLLNGQWKNTDLGNIYRKITDSSAKEGDMFFYDFAPYAPSNNVPAGFIATPVFYKGQKIGGLAFQMPIERINHIMSDGSGLGETG